MNYFKGLFIKYLQMVSSIKTVLQVVIELIWRREKVNFSVREGCLIVAKIMEPAGLL